MVRYLIVLYEFDSLSVSRNEHTLVSSFTTGIKVADKVAKMKAKAKADAMVAVKKLELELAKAKAKAMAMAETKAKSSSGVTSLTMYQYAVLY